jgi:hypothetical protein
MGQILCGPSVRESDEALADDFDAKQFARSVPGGASRTLNVVMLVSAASEVTSQLAVGVLQYSAVFCSSLCGGLQRVVACGAAVSSCYS